MYRLPFELRDSEKLLHFTILGVSVDPPPAPLNDATVIAESMSEKNRCTFGDVTSTNVIVSCTCAPGQRTAERRLLAVRWPSAQVHEPTTLFLVTLRNIHRFKGKIHAQTRAVDAYLAGVARVDAVVKAFRLLATHAARRQDMRCTAHTSPHRRQPASQPADQPPKHAPATPMRYRRQQTSTRLYTGRPANMTRHTKK